MDYSSIRKQSRKAHSMAYANGGRVKSAKTVINIINPPASGGGAGAAPPIAGAGPAPAVSPRPVPPVAGNAALAGMGAPPMLANGGRVCKATGGRVPAGKVPGPMAKKAGAASGEGRLKRSRNPKSKM